MRQKGSILNKLVILSNNFGTLLLAEKGVGLEDFAILQFIIYPFVLKWVFAPFLDTYYNTKFGKRKTYIVPIQYLLSFCLFALSCRIQHYVDNK